jgi:hypothetical protein
MPISGLLITLNADESLAAEALAAVSGREEFTPGLRHGRWLPVVMEARDDAQSRELHDGLQALAGVDFVDVVYVDFDMNQTSPSEISR